MEPKTKKLIIILGSSIFLATLIYVKFLRKEDQKFDGMGNYALLDKDKQSKTDIYKDKRKAELQKIAEDRKVSSIEAFLSDNIEKDPFAGDTTEVLDTLASDSQPVSVAEKPKVIIQYVEREPKKKQEVETVDMVEPVAETKTAPRRKAGFSSVGSSAKSNPANSSVSSANIPVVVQETTKVKTGQSITMRTTEVSSVDGLTIPANTIISGRVTLSANRLNITVTSFSVGGNLVSKSLEAYGSDGSKGIEVEGGVENQIKNTAVNDAISTVQQTVKVPVLKDLPVRAGKKIVNDPEVTVSKGHTLYLRKE